MPSEDLIISKSKSMLLFWFGAAVLSVLLAWNFMQPADGSFEQERILIYSGGIVAATIFSGLFIYDGFRILLVRPMLVISDRGMIDKMSRYRFGIIPWTDINKIAVRGVSFSRALRIYPKENTQVASAIARRHIGATKDYLEFTVLNVDDNAIALIKRYCEKVQVAPSRFF